MIQHSYHDPFEDYKDEEGRLHGRIYNKMGMFCYSHGLRHNEKGAAILYYNNKGYPSGTEWWLYGEKITRELFLIATRGPKEKLPLLMGQGVDRYIAERLSR